MLKRGFLSCFVVLLSILLILPEHSFGGLMITHSGSSDEECAKKCKEEPEIDCRFYKWHRVKLTCFLSSHNDTSISHMKKIDKPDLPPGTKPASSWISQLQARLKVLEKKNTDIKDMKKGLADVRTEMVGLKNSRALTHHLIRTNKEQLDKNLEVINDKMDVLKSEAKRMEDAILTLGEIQKSFGKKITTINQDRKSSGLSMAMLGQSNKDMKSSLRELSTLTSDLQQSISQVRKDMTKIEVRFAGLSSDVMEKATSLETMIGPELKEMRNSQTSLAEALSLITKKIMALTPRIPEIQHLITVNDGKVSTVAEKVKQFHREIAQLTGRVGFAESQLRKFVDPASKINEDRRVLTQQIQEKVENLGNSQKRLQNDVLMEISDRTRLYKELAAMKSSKKHLLQELQNLGKNYKNMEQNMRNIMFNGPQGNLISKILHRQVEVLKKMKTVKEEQTRMRMDVGQFYSKIKFLNQTEKNDSTTSNKNFTNALRRMEERVVKLGRIMRNLKESNWKLEKIKVIEVNLKKLLRKMNKTEAKLNAFMRNYNSNKRVDPNQMNNSNSRKSSNYRGNVYKERNFNKEKDFNKESKFNQRVNFNKANSFKIGENMQRDPQWSNEQNYLEKLKVKTDLLHEIVKETIKESPVEEKTQGVLAKIAKIIQRHRETLEQKGRQNISNEKTNQPSDMSFKPYENGVKLPDTQGMKSKPEDESKPDVWENVENEIEKHRRDILLNSKYHGMPNKNFGGSDNGFGEKDDKLMQLEAKLAGVIKKIDKTEMKLDTLIKENTTKAWENSRASTINLPQIQENQGQELLRKPTNFLNLQGQNKFNMTQGDDSKSDMFTRVDHVLQEYRKDVLQEPENIDVRGKDLPQLDENSVHVQDFSSFEKPNPNEKRMKEFEASLTRLKEKLHKTEKTLMSVLAKKHKKLHIHNTQAIKKSNKESNQEHLDFLALNVKTNMLRDLVKKAVSNSGKNQSVSEVLENIDKVLQDHRKELQQNMHRYNLNERKPNNKEDSWLETLDLKLKRKSKSRAESPIGADMNKGAAVTLGFNLTNLLQKMEERELTLQQAFDKTKINKSHDIKQLKEKHRNEIEKLITRTDMLHNYIMQINSNQNVKTIKKVEANLTSLLHKMNKTEKALTSFLNDRRPTNASSHRPNEMEEKKKYEIEKLKAKTEMLSDLMDEVIKNNPKGKSAADALGRIGKILMKHRNQLEQEVKKYGGSEEEKHKKNSVNKLSLKKSLIDVLKAEYETKEKQIENMETRLTGLLSKMNTTESYLQSALEKTKLRNESFVSLEDKMKAREQARHEIDKLRARTGMLHNMIQEEMSSEKVSRINKVESNLTHLLGKMNITQAALQRVIEKTFKNGSLVSVSKQNHPKTNEDKNLELLQAKTKVLHDIVQQAVKSGGKYQISPDELVRIGNMIQKHRNELGQAAKKYLKGQKINWLNSRRYKSSKKDNKFNVIQSMETNLTNLLTQMGKTEFSLQGILKRTQVNRKHRPGARKHLTEKKQHEFKSLRAKLDSIDDFLHQAISNQKMARIFKMEKNLTNLFSKMNKTEQALSQVLNKGGHNIKHFGLHRKGNRDEELMELRVKTNFLYDFINRIIKDHAHGKVSSEDLARIEKFVRNHRKALERKTMDYLKGSEKGAKNGFHHLNSEKSFLKTEVKKINQNTDKLESKLIPLVERMNQKITVLDGVLNQTQQPNERSHMYKNPQSQHREKMERKIAKIRAKTNSIQDYLQDMIRKNKFDKIHNMESNLTKLFDEIKQDQLAVDSSVENRHARSLDHFWLKEKENNELDSLKAKTQLLLNFVERSPTSVLGKKEALDKVEDKLSNLLKRMDNTESRLVHIVKSSRLPGMVSSMQHWKANNGEDELETLRAKTNLLHNQVQDEMANQRINRVHRVQDYLNNLMWKIKKTTESLRKIMKKGRGASLGSYKKWVKNQRMVARMKARTGILHHLVQDAFINKPYGMDPSRVILMRVGKLLGSHRKELRKKAKVYLKGLRKGQLPSAVHSTELHNRLENLHDTFSKMVQQKTRIKLKEMQKNEKKLTRRLSQVDQKERRLQQILNKYNIHIYSDLNHYHTWYDNLFGHHLKPLLSNKLNALEAYLHGGPVDSPSALFYLRHMAQTPKNVLMWKTLNHLWNIRHNHRFRLLHNHIQDGNPAVIPHPLLPDHRDLLPHPILDDHPAVFPHPLLPDHRGLLLHPILEDHPAVFPHPLLPDHRDLLPNPILDEDNQPVMIPQPLMHKHLLEAQPNHPLLPFNLDIPVHHHLEHVNNHLDALTSLG